MIPNLYPIDGKVESGFAIALDDELLNGTSTPCATFLSPSLVDGVSMKGEIFEVANMEAWTFTPCSSVEQAERNELHYVPRRQHRLRRYRFLRGRPVTNL